MTRARIAWQLGLVAFAATGCDTPCLPSGDVTVRATGTLAVAHGDVPTCFETGQLVGLGQIREATISEDGAITFVDDELTATTDSSACSFTIVQDLSGADQTGEALWYADEKKSRQRWEGFGSIELTRADGACGNSIFNVKIDVMVAQ